MPEIDTVVLTIEKAGPGEERRLQSITVLLLPFKPTILTSEKLLLMITLDSSKYPAARYTMLAFRDWIAYAMVLQGGSKLQEDESTPWEGLTLTNTSAPSVTWRHNNAQSRMALVNDATRYELILDARIIALNFLGAGYREALRICKQTASKLHMAATWPAGCGHL
jgi:hypothetical protein